MIQLMEEEYKKYQRKIVELKTSQQAIVAFVIFKSAAWQQKALEIFKMSQFVYYFRKFKQFVRWLLGKCFDSFNKKPDQDDVNSFKDETLTAYPSVDPQLIIW